MSIPKNIHFIWMQGADKFPDKYLSNIKATSDLNPDWKIYKWDENSIREELKKLGNKYLQKFDSFKILHQKVDFGRYALLYLWGGISVDADATAIKPFNNIPHINDSNFIVGYSPLDKVGNIAQGNERRAINNATIISSKENPILKEVLDYILTLDCKPNQSDFSCIIFTTGQSFNEVVYKHKGEIIILDNSYFESCHGNDDYCEIPDNAIIFHKHAQTWVPPSHQKIAKLYYGLKNYKTPIFALLLFILVLIIAKRYK